MYTFLSLRLLHECISKCFVKFTVAKLLNPTYGKYIENSNIQRNIKKKSTFSTGVTKSVQNLNENLDSTDVCDVCEC